MATIPPRLTIPPLSTDNTDIVTQIMGPFGRWQLRTILLIFLCKIPSAWFMACVIYTAPTPQKGDYYCKPSAAILNASTDMISVESETEAWIEVPHHGAKRDRVTDRLFRMETCNIYEEALEQNFVRHFSNYTNPFEKPSATELVTLNVIPCEEFEHHTEYSSLVTQFDLVCSRQLLVSVTQSFHAVGAFAGGLASFQALKYMSPRRLMLWGMIGQIICGNLTGLVTTFHLHVYFRCLTSLFCAFMYTSGQVILADITAGKAKLIVCTLFELFWSIGLILLPAISIFFDSWSYLYVAISTSVVALVGLHRWITDAPRWLLRHNKLDRALQILLESAAYNNREIPLNLEVQLWQYSRVLREEIEPNYWSIWNGKTPRKYLYAIHWAWLGAAILFNVMLLMIRSLGVEHIHVNTASLGFAEMVGVFLGLFLILYTRHRWLWTGYLLILAGGLAYLVWAVPQTIKDNRRNGIHMIFWMFLKLANSCSLSVMTVCTAELVSPPKRPMLMLSVSTFSRMGLIVGPFLSVFTVISKLFPITIFATLAVVNGILMCLLNCNFWHTTLPRIQRVLTPNTYRRNSSIVLLRRRSSASSEMDLIDGNSNTSSSSSYPGGCDNLAHSSISISDLWRAEAMRFETIAEHSDGIEITETAGRQRSRNDPVLATTSL